MKNISLTCEWGDPIPEIGANGKVDICGKIEVFH